MEQDDILTAESGTVGCWAEGCGRKVLAKGLCFKHYARDRRNGSPLVLQNAPAGAGTVRPDGYRSFRRGGVETLEHRLIAERALGKPLPKGVEVHHVDLARGSKDPGALVICPDRAYHRLLHQRADAMEACGNPSWLKCVYCKTYDAPEAMSFYTNKKGCTNQFHAQCKRDSAKARYHAKKGTSNECRI